MPVAEHLPSSWVQDSLKKNERPLGTQGSSIYFITLQPQAGVSASGSTPVPDTSCQGIPAASHTVKDLLHFALSLALGTGLPLL